MQEATAKIDEYARGMISGSGSTLFEELGLYYIGPTDGHNLDVLISILQGACRGNARVYIACGPAAMRLQIQLRTAASEQLRCRARSQRT